MSQQSVVAVIEDIPGYAALFKAAFGDPAITFDRFAKAIASFERTILSDNSLYDRYKGGDKWALTAAQRRGMEIFERKGKCTECHSGYNFTAGKFANLGIGMDRPKPDVGPSRNHREAPRRG